MSVQYMDFEESHNAPTIIKKVQKKGYAETTPTNKYKYAYYYIW